MTQVAAGDDHCLALTLLGVFAWGSNTCGQVGAGSTVLGSRIVTPCCVAGPEAGSSSQLVCALITAVAAGGLHSCALTSSGWLLTWGCSLMGQCGHGSTSNVAEPTPVASLGGVPLQCVAAGAAHTVVIGERGGEHRALSMWA